MGRSARERFLFVLIAVAAAARAFSLNWLRPITWDEIEYFRATDWVRQGLVPYRDFWEHHTPLQWFLFAPVAALTNSPGVSAVLLLRWAQVPFWIATFFLLLRWMRDAGISPLARAASLLLLLCSSLFMLGAIEYRVDALGCMLYVAALFCLQRLEWKRSYAIAAGILLCLGGFANLRLGPLLALTILVPRVVQTRERKWAGRPQANWVFLGAGVTFLLVSLYFVFTNSLMIAFKRVWVENYLGDRLAPGMEWVLLQRLVVPFGFNAIDPFRSGFQLGAVDVATIALFIVGTIGLIRALRERFRNPDDVFLLAFFQVASILFVCAMKYIHYYHFEILLLLAVPFVGMEIDRQLVKNRWQHVAAILIFASLVNLFASVFRGKEEDLAYEDVVMRQAHAMTTADARVFDGVGWVLRRKPAYYHWFLPSLVQVLEEKKIFAPYNAEQMMSDPPAIIVADYRAYLWFRLHPPLGRFASAHYIPVARSLWVPGLSTVVSPAHPQMDWIVPASGSYRVYASELLATHPWFRNPLAVGSFDIPPQLEVALRGFPPPSQLPLTWSVDGQPANAESLRLVRMQRLHVASTSARPLGIVIVPENVHELFRQPAPGVGIDSFSPVETHIPRVPDLW